MYPETFFLRLNKKLQHLPDSVVFYAPIIIKTFIMKKIVFALMAVISMLALNAQSEENKSKQMKSINQISVHDAHVGA